MPRGGAVAVAVAVSLAVAVVVVVVVVWGFLQGDAGNFQRCHMRLGGLGGCGGSCPLANHRWGS